MKNLIFSLLLGTAAGLGAASSPVGAAGVEACGDEHLVLQEPVVVLVAGSGAVEGEQQIWGASEIYYEGGLYADHAFFTLETVQ